MRSLLASVLEAVRSAASAYGRHACSQLAAAIAYRVLFSIVPFLALLLSILDVVLPATAREQFTGWLFGEIPGTEVEASAERALAGSGWSAPVVGLVALGTLLWAASGMMASIRTAFRVIWEADSGPKYVRAKLLDLALVAGAGALVVAAFVLSLVVQVVVRVGADLSDAAGWSGAAGAVTALGEVASSGLVAFGVLLALYRLVPPVRPGFAELWPSTLTIAIAFQLASAGFAFYLAHFADFSSVYGPLGAVLAFLLLVYVLAGLVLFGAELVAGRRRSPA